MGFSYSYFFGLRNLQLFYPVKYIQVGIFIYKKTRKAIKLYGFYNDKRIIY